MTLVRSSSLHPAKNGFPVGGFHFMPYPSSWPVGSCCMLGDSRALAASNIRRKSRGNRWAASVALGSLSFGVGRSWRNFRDSEFLNRELYGTQMGKIEFPFVGGRVVSFIFHDQSGNRQISDRVLYRRRIDPRMNLWAVMAMHQNL